LDKGTMEIRDRELLATLMSCGRCRERGGGARLVTDEKRGSMRQWEGLKRTLPQPKKIAVFERRTEHREGGRMHTRTAHGRRRME